jgi:plastocyanin
MRSIWIIASILAVFSTPAYAAEHVVNQKQLTFTPEAITIAPGDTIRFTNGDRTAHHIMTADQGANISSPLLPPGNDFTVKLDKPGVYVFGCHIHPKMALKVTVK